MLDSFVNFILFPFLYFIVQITLFVIVYLTIRKNRNDLYHILYSEKEKQKTEDLEKQRKRITEIYKTQLDIRQTKNAFEQASTNEDIDREKIKEILDRLKEDYTTANLTTVAELEGGQGNFEKALEYINKAIELDFETPELWRVKASFLNSLNRPSEEQEAKTRYIEFLNKENFNKNLKREIVLGEIEFRNLPFYGSFVWPLKSKINVLLGKNGYGKSHLLSIVLAQLQEETSTLVELSRINSIVSDSLSEKSFLRLRIDSGEPRKSEEIIKLQKEVADFINQKSSIEELLNRDRDSSNQLLNEIIKEKVIELDKVSKEIELRYDKIDYLAGRSFFDRTGSIQSTYGKIPVLAIPDLRFINKSGESTPTIIDEKAKKILEYGAYHFINQAPYENAIQNFLNTICNIYLDTKTFGDEIFQLINRVFKILTGNEFVWKEIYRTQDNSGFIIKVKTEGNNDPLPIQKVSQGTLSVLSIVGLIFHYLGLRYPDVNRNELRKKQAVVFIDEIDAHLHPSWQQKIIGILRNEFPNIQFVITAHSPLIVAGCKEDEVAVLRERRKPEDNSIVGFFVEKLYEDFIGYSTDELYKKIFEIENRDENYLKYISLIPGKAEMETKVKALEELRTKGILSSDDQLKLTALSDDLYYMEKAKQRLDSVVDVEKLKMENQRLQMELEIEIGKSNPKIK